MAAFSFEFSTCQWRFSCFFFFFKLKFICSRYSFPRKGISFFFRLILFALFFSFLFFKSIWSSHVYIFSHLEWEKNNKIYYVRNCAPTVVLAFLFWFLFDFYFKPDNLCAKVISNERSLTLEVFGSIISVIFCGLTGRAFVTGKVIMILR